MSCIFSYVPCCRKFNQISKNRKLNSTVTLFLASSELAHSNLEKQTHISSHIHRFPHLKLSFLEPNVPFTHANPQRKLKTLNNFPRSANDFLSISVMFHLQFQFTFDPPGSEFEDWIPDDHKENPMFIANIKDAEYRQWARELNNLWLLLGRKMKNEVKVSYNVSKLRHAEIIRKNI